MEDAAAMKKGVDVRVDYRADGSYILTNRRPLPAIEGTIPGRLRYWARRTPDAIFLSQGETLLSYGEAELVRRDLAARLLNLSLDDGRPLMIVADNGLNHAMIMLAANSVGIPVAIVSPSYVAPVARPWAKFARVFDQIDPPVIFADDVAAVGEALGETANVAELRQLRDLAWLRERDRLEDALVDAAESRVGLDTVAKLLFTSGSTGHPKAVVNTQRMMVSNMLGISVVWPFLSERPPVSVD